MRRWLWILGAVLVLLGGSGEERKLEHLRPAALLYVREQAGELRVETDLGDHGRGRTMDEAMENMQKTASGRILLDTIDLLVMEEKAVYALQEAADFLRPATEVAVGGGEIDPEKAAAYLHIHKPGLTLQQLRQESCRPPVLRGRGGRYSLER